jgi:hypothetical protein
VISELISFVYIIGGLKLLFETRKRYNLYLAVGFILYGLQYLLNLFVIEDALITLILKTPQLLGSLCLFLSPYYYITGGRR